jgi:hypothetical protein
MMVENPTPHGIGSRCLTPGVWPLRDLGGTKQPHLAAVFVL